MKTKSSRKRLLVSSVAMLLVAMLALGTATYAWFTSSTNVTANGITVRTSKTSKLAISDDTIDYSPSGFTYTGMKSIMVPASSADGKQWFYTNAKDNTAFTASNTSSFSTVPDATANSYVYKNQLNIQNAGDQPIKNIQITISNFSGDYLRVALVPVDNKVAGGDTTMTAANFRANVYGNTTATPTPDNTKYYPVESTTAISTTAITPKTNKVINVTTGDETLAAAAEVHYNLFVWFEGQDPKCFDGKAGQGVTDLQFAVTGTPVAETA